MTIPAHHTKTSFLIRVVDESIHSLNDVVELGALRVNSFGTISSRKTILCQQVSKVSRQIVVDREALLISGALTDNYTKRLNMRRTRLSSVTGV
jgi:hypothetical protein